LPLEELDSALAAWFKQARANEASLEISVRRPCKLLVIWEWTTSQVLMVGLTVVGVDTVPEPSEVKELIQEQ